MSDPINPIAAAAAQQQAAAAGTPANQPGSSTGNPSQIFVSNMNDLETKAPEFYKAMVEGIITKVISDSRHHNDEMKRIIHEGEENNNKR